MKQSNQPQQHTDVLMLPVGIRRAEELGRNAGDAAPTMDYEQGIDELLELILGIAAIEDPQDRQGVALCAAIAVYSQTRHCQADLARYMAGYWKASASK
jgi:hypothetical protein